MTLYEYECLNCKAKFQKFARAMNRYKVSCPGCGEKKVKKLWVIIPKLGSSCKRNCSGCRSSR